MSQQQRVPIGSIELQYHDSKAQTDAIIATLIREYKKNDIQLIQQINALRIENQKLLNKYEPKKDEKPKKN